LLNYFVEINYVSRAAVSRRRTTRAPGAAPRPSVDAFLGLVHALRVLQLDAGGDRSWCALDISMAQLKAIVLLVHTGGLTARGLAERLGVSPSAITLLVDRMAAQQLVRRERDSADRRRVWIRPAPKARALHDALNRTSRSVVTKVFLGLPRHQRRAAGVALRALLTSAESVLAERA